KTMYFSFERKNNGGESGVEPVIVTIQNYYENGSVDISAYNLQEADIQNFFADTRDLADNLNKHMFFFNN
ncbi:MAG: hypothetical protein MI892_24560, partial [Desulfobacterales bacterium]|nr:hypothetical protein [Desulfobacterales bacterium]